MQLLKDILHAFREIFRGFIPLVGGSVLVITALAFLIHWLFGFAGMTPFFLAASAFVASLLAFVVTVEVKSIRERRKMSEMFEVKDKDNG